MTQYRVFSATITTTANGTSCFFVESQHARDTALALSLCGCGHTRIHHYTGNVTTPGFDWRGGTGPCQKKKCKCKAFEAAQ